MKRSGRKCVVCEEDAIVNFLGLPSDCKTQLYFAQRSCPARSERKMKNRTARYPGLLRIGQRANTQASRSHKESERAQRHPPPHSDRAKNLPFSNFSGPLPSPNRIPCTIRFQ